MLHDAVGAEFREIADRLQDGRPAKAVIAVRTYDTSVEDLWDALTNRERIPRWFMPIEGELRLGGRYQLQGNAGGTITRCDPPEALEVTWEFGGGVTWVTVRLESDGHGARMTLEHIMLTTDMDGDHWKQFGPGAVGVGWDLSIMGLGLHIASGDAKPSEADPAWVASDEGKAVMRASAMAWAEAHIASGEDSETARAMAKRTAGFYTGEA